VVGDGETAMLAYYLLVRDRLEVGDRAGSEAAADRLRDLARSARQPLHPWRVLLVDALFAQLDGDQDAAERIALDACRYGQAAAIPNAVPALSGLLLMVREEQGRVAELLGMMTDLRARLTRYSTLGPIIAWCQVAAGDEAAARSTFAAVMERWDDVVEDEAFLCTGYVAGTVAEALRDEAAGERVLARLLPHRDRVAVVPGPTASSGPVALTLGRMAAVAGRDDEAHEYLDTAAEVAERLGSPLWVGRVARARAALAPAGRGRPLPAGLTEREAEVLQLISLGLTNREVAERLVLGVRTIDSHVATVYRKVGVRRRADAVTFAVANGLVDLPAP
jgi:DNA-binding CsgD family transcriptional regulator